MRNWVWYSQNQGHRRETGEEFVLIPLFVKTHWKQGMPSTLSISHSRHVPYTIFLHFCAMEFHDPFFLPQPWIPAHPRTWKIYRSMGGNVRPEVYEPPILHKWQMWLSGYPSHAIHPPSRHWSFELWSSSRIRALGWSVNWSRPSPSIMIVTCDWVHHPNRSATQRAWCLTFISVHHDAQVHCRNNTFSTESSTVYIKGKVHLLSGILCIQRRTSHMSITHPDTSALRDVPDELLASILSELEWDEVIVARQVRTPS